MQFEERVVGDIAILTVTGDITLKKGGETRLHEKVDALVQRGHRKVLIDLARVSFVDSAGLGELVQAHAITKNHGGSLGVFNVARRLMDLLSLTRLTTLFPAYATESEALASLGARQA